MNTIDLKKKLHNMIDSADEKKLRDIYSVLKSQADENQDFWENPEFINELKRRDSEYNSGLTKGFKVEQSVNRAKKAIYDK